MQLSHDEKVFLASSRGFWRANSDVASNEGMAKPQARRQGRSVGGNESVRETGSGQRVYGEMVNCDATLVRRLGL